MLQKINYKLRCTAPGTVLGNAGSELHALLFNALHSANKDFAAKIHALELKPFTLGPLNGRSTREGGRFIIEKDYLYSFELASLETEMTEYLPLIRTYLAGSDIRLGGARFILEEAKPLFKKPRPYFKLMTSDEVKEELGVVFKSPACFRRNGKLNLFPLPDLLLSGLARRWAHFSDAALPDYNTDTIMVTKYGLKTSLVKFDRYNLVGFRGFCSYSFTKEARDIDRWSVSVLLNYGTIAGVGYKTTMGMGQIRVI